MEPTARARVQGLFIALAGALMSGAGLIGAKFDFDALSAGLIPGPALFAVGLMMLLWPGTSASTAARFDFVDWFENLPLAVRIRYFAATGLGLAFGVGLSLYLLDWDFYRALL